MESNKSGGAIQELDHCWIRIHPHDQLGSSDSAQINVQYGFVVTGPFILPDGYKLVSPVVYLDLNMDVVSKPLDLHIPTWSSDPTSVRYIKAPHVSNAKGQYIFQLLSSDKNSETVKVFHLCLIAKVVQMKIPEKCYISWWEKQELDGATYMYRVAVTHAIGLWLKVCIMAYRSISELPCRIYIYKSVCTCDV